MSYTQRRSIIGFILTLILLPLFYFIYMKDKLPLDLNGPIDYKAWVWSFIIFFIILIVVRILLTILQFIIEFIAYVIKNKDKDKEVIETNLRSHFIEDERYKLVDMKASRHIGSIMTFGFILSMILIVSGIGPAILFYVMYLSMGISGLVLDALIIYYEARN